MHTLWRASAFSGRFVWSDLAGSKKPHCGRGREVPCFGVEAAVREPVGEGECVPAFTRESECGAFVSEVEKRNKERLGDKIYGGSFA